MLQSDFSSTSYEHQLKQKLESLQQQFSCFDLPAIEVFRSPEIHFRMRAEFRIWHKGERSDYVMFDPETRQPYPIKDFPIGSLLMNQLMPPLMEAINNIEVLRHKLFQIDFLTSLNNQALVTLIYHKPLNEEWQAAARQIKNTLGIDIVGRSRKQKILLDKDYVIERLMVNDRPYEYQQIESSFTQPNARVCEKMLGWAVNKSTGSGGDLLELYCGNGNFTLPLSQNFRQVLATEVSKTSVNSALFNITHNKISNIQVVRMSSEEFTQAMDATREFNRLKQVQLQDYQFSTIFVDPPRAGLDPDTTVLTQRFDNILYISCNPQTLHENLQTLTLTHNIIDFAVFDQFPYTHHLECGVVLQRK